MFPCVPPGPTQYIFHTPMTRYSLFVLKVSLNTNKTNNLGVSKEVGPQCSPIFRVPSICPCILLMQNAQIYRENTYRRGLFWGLATPRLSSWGFTLFMPTSFNAEDRVGKVTHMGEGHVSCGQPSLPSKVVWVPAFSNFGGSLSVFIPFDID